MIYIPWRINPNTLTLRFVQRETNEARQDVTGTLGHHFGISRVSYFFFFSSNSSNVTRTRIQLRAITQNYRVIVDGPPEIVAALPALEVLGNFVNQRSLSITLTCFYE